MQITRDMFLAHYRREFGNANPQRITNPFWEFMIRSGQSAYRGGQKFFPQKQLDEAVWCFDRFGMPLTKLPDGRQICIAGEHEDHYDPDFCIYNDFIVFTPFQAQYAPAERAMSSVEYVGGRIFEPVRPSQVSNSRIDIFGYPKEVFPPTDFHTATLVDDDILIVGSIGYVGERQIGETPVYRLNCSTYAIEQIATDGEKPGWISRHQARFDPAKRILTSSVENPFLYG